MGDRSNVYFRNGKTGIGVYAHWGGLAMAEAAAAVLTSKPFKARLGDPSYATRIGVQIVLAALGATAADETGFGLWTSASGSDDNEYPFVVIDVDSGECFVARAWDKVKRSELVAEPTAARIAERMQGAGEAAPAKAKVKPKGKPKLKAVKANR